MTSHEARFDYISNWAINILDHYPIKKVYLEGYAYGARGQVFNIGENTGLLKHKIWNAGYDYDVIQPSMIKKFATGKGNANKEKMNESFESETSINIRDILSQTEKQWNPSSDLIDAYYILKTGLSNDAII